MLARFRSAISPSEPGHGASTWFSVTSSKNDPSPLSEAASVELVELIPPFHQRVYRMGLEHVGIVVGADLDDFSRRHRAVLTGQQFQSSVVEPVYILFDDYTHVKFHQRSLKDACEAEGRAFVGFQHVDWHPADELAGPYEVA